MYGTLDDWMRVAYQLNKASNHCPVQAHCPQSITVRELVHAECDGHGGIPLKVPTADGNGWPSLHDIAGHLEIRWLVAH